MTISKSKQKLITTAELAAHFNVHERTTRSWRKEGLPYLKICGTVRFNLQAVEIWISSGRVVRDVI